MGKGLQVLRMVIPRVEQVEGLPDWAERAPQQAEMTVAPQHE